MENALLLVFGQQCAQPTGFPVQSAETSSPMALGYGRSPVDMYHRKSDSTDTENCIKRSDWTAATTVGRRGGCRAPFDMDTLKAAIQAARPDRGEVRRAILSCTFKPRERAFTRLINMCGRQKESRKAIEVFETMNECRGVRPNTYTYSALISACGNAGEWDLAISVYEWMKRAAASDPGCRPNQVTYHAIIAASERGGRYDVCLSCFQEMVNSSAPPDAVACCSAIHACQRMENWNEAERILLDMHARDLVASASVYACIIEHYATIADWKLALDLFLTMQLQGQAVDERCCGALMMALEAGQQSDMAYQLIQAMQANRIDINGPIYLSALRTMAISDMWEEATELTHTVLEHGLTIPSDELSQLTAMLEDAGQEELATRVSAMLAESSSDGC